MNLVLSAAATEASSGILDAIENVNGVVNDFIWGPIMCVVFMLVGVFLTFRTRWFQVSRIGLWWKSTIASVFRDRSVRRTEDKKSISQFQALSTALASTIGTGNIAGVSTAIISGGPGAVFWMWISAFFGMMTKYSEILLSLKYREKNENGDWLGGPMLFLEKGLKQKWLAVLFAIFATFASFGIGSAVQANSVAGALNEAFGFDPLIVGIVIAALAAIIIIGGIKRIARVTEYLVPFMAILYIVSGIALIAMNAQNIGPAFASIFQGAFNLQSVGGGVLGFTIAQGMRFGVARGIFSNEAGMGSSAMAHSASDAKEPVKQAMWGVFEVFADTIIVCTISALAVLTTGVHLVANEAGEMVMSSVSGAALTSQAFGATWGQAGQIFLAVGLSLFAFSTIIGWSYYGERTYEYLFGPKTTVIYKVIFLATIILGTVGGLDLVWNISDTLNGLMAIPNLIGVVALSGTVAAMTKQYVAARKDSGRALDT